MGEDRPGGRFVYGPVPSRRLGRSLGVDLVPLKTCSYDCVYCQLGRTTDKTIKRAEYAPADEVLAELRLALAAGDAPDYISLAGSGEPTLHSGIGQLLAGIKDITTVPVAVITNGSLLWMEQVREELANADLVLPSLDAGDERLFGRINRPDPAVSFELLIAGLAAFAGSFRGETWLEVMLLPGLTDTEDEVRKIADLVENISPTRTQLNTPVRPAAEDSVRPLPKERLRALSYLFEGRVDVVCDPARIESESPLGRRSASTDILALLARRPCTAEDIAAGLGLHVLDVLKYLGRLVAEGKTERVRIDDRVFYEPTARD